MINYIEIFNKIKDILLFYWNNNKGHIISYCFIFGFLYLIISGYIPTCNRNNSEEINKAPVYANYYQDTTFLECIAEQHSCIYINLKNEISPQKIQELCGYEDFCATRNSNPK